MEYQWLTPEDQLLLDPYGLNRNAIRAIPLHGSRYNPPSTWYRVTPDQAFSFLRQVRSQMNCERHKPYIIYMDEMDSKCGPQGGWYSRTEMLDKLKPYYECATHIRKMHRILIQGRDYLIRRIKQIASDWGYPVPAYVAIIRTNAASPTGLKKGDYLAEVTGAKPWRHMFPAVLGQRRMRGKDRLIFQDSVLNVRYIERELTGCRNWLKEHLPEYFGAWCNPERFINKSFTNSLRHRAWFVETDYIHMDERFSLQLVNEIILPIYEVLMPDAFISFASAIEELFNQAVYCGDFLVTGLHNLFSGEGITNDFETLYTICLYLGVALELHTIEDSSVAAIGDDCTVALNCTNGTLPAKFRDLMIEVSNQADMLIHDDEKSRIVFGETRFCRRVYYPAGPKTVDGVLTGAYPLNLALNNIIQPEHIQSNPSFAAVADLQRMDNCFGAIGWTELVQYLWKQSTHKFASLDPRCLEKDWWLRVYGEKWSPESSPTVRLYQRMYSQHHDSRFYTLL